MQAEGRRQKPVDFKNKISHTLYDTVSLWVVGGRYYDSVTDDTCDLRLKRELNFIYLTYDEGLVKPGIPQKIDDFTLLISYTFWFCIGQDLYTFGL